MQRQVTLFLALCQPWKMRSTLTADDASDGDALAFQTEMTRRGRRCTKGDRSKKGVATDSNVAIGQSLLISNAADHGGGSCLRRWEAMQLDFALCMLGDRPGVWPREDGGAVLGTIQRSGTWRSLAVLGPPHSVKVQRSFAVLSGSVYAKRGSFDSFSPPDASVLRLKKEEEQTFVQVQRLTTTEFYVGFITVSPPSRAGVRLPTVQRLEFAGPLDAQFFGERCFNVFFSPVASGKKNLLVKRSSLLNTRSVKPDSRSASLLPSAWPLLCVIGAGAGHNFEKCCSQLQGHHSLHLEVHVARRRSP